MPAYTAPIDDMDFLLTRVFADEAPACLPGCEEFTPDLMRSVTEEAARYCVGVLAPLNRSGDENGCVYENGVVRTPPGFKEAYDGWREGGWPGLGADPAYGGQGAPQTLGVLVQEILCATNLAFSNYPGLSHGAYHALAAHGSDELKQRFLPPLVEGRFSGTMCLTEPHCGTDLGLARTKAVPRADGSYAITGTKIFITAGEHDLTDNILHLVLARLPDAPEGIKGLSLFLVPKLLVGADGALGARNGVQCGGIEHKMGIHASATCVINFDDAEGYLVGTPHKGMRSMFTMMNAARLAVGIQGLGIAEAAYQGAVGYARERLQGRALGGARAPDQPADPLLVHPDVRRVLLTMRAWTEGMRALSMWVATRLDVAEHATDPAARQSADDFVSLLTPVVKSLFTDVGSEMANLGMQIWGGHGYIRENGMEQLVRDARIAQIYEGANGVQALDLVGRKLPAHGGRFLRGFFHPVAAYLDAKAGDPQIGDLVAAVAKAFGRLQRATGWIAERGMADPDEAGAASSDYLRLFGLVAVGYVWLRMAEAASNGENGIDPRFLRAKVDTARIFCERLLPESGARYAAIMAGGRGLMRFDDAAF